MQEHALVAPRGGQLLRTFRPLSGAFWLDRLHAERVGLTAEAALEFCGGDAEDGCNCCCDGAILGTATFLEDVNQCTANYCYDLDGEQHSNCSALYAEVSSDGVPRFSPPTPSQPPRPPRSPPCPPWLSPPPPPATPLPGDSSNADAARPGDAETPAAQPNPAEDGVPLLQFPAVACNLTIAAAGGLRKDLVKVGGRADLRKDLVAYLSEALPELGRPLLLADVDAEVPDGGGIVAASVDPESIVVVLTIHFGRSEEAEAEQARDALAALLDDRGTRSLDDVLDVTVEQHTLPQLVALPSRNAPVAAAAPPLAPASPQPSPPQPPMPPPFCPLRHTSPPAPTPAASRSRSAASASASSAFVSSRQQRPHGQSRTESSSVPV